MKNKYPTVREIVQAGTIGEISPNHCAKILSIAQAASLGLKNVKRSVGSFRSSGFILSI